jgi:hypothetical protein
MSRRHTSRRPRGPGAPAHAPSHAPSGDIAFDEYREGVPKRLEAERRRLDALAAEFGAFLRNLRRAKDQEEFERFMASRSRGEG